jgi:ubiquinone/menaquinone biosynthesis C-methylase UbiE
MADTPLGTGSCDAAVFSLALMGLDYGAFLVEAARVLKQNGWLWIAEVRCVARISRSRQFNPAAMHSTQMTFNACGAQVRSTTCICNAG